MKKLMVYLSLPVVAAFAALLFVAAPLRAQVAVVNAASFHMGFPVAPGGLVSAFGDFSGVSQEATATLPLPTMLGGAGVMVNGAPAPLIFVSAGQINLQVPYATPVGRILPISISVNGAEVATGTLVASETDPAIFADTSDPTLPAAVVHADGSVNSSQNPANRGDTVLVYGTGIGPVDNPPADGHAPDGLSSGTETARAFFGGQEGVVLWSGLAPGFVGLWQLNITIPSESFVAGQIPLLVTLGGRPSSNQVTIFIAE